MKSKMLSLLFVVVSLASCVSVEVDETVKIGDLYYKLDAKEQVASVVPYPDYMNISSDISIANIPAYVTYMNNSYAVTKIGNYAFQYCGKLNSVFIPNSVTEIGDYAFYVIVYPYTRGKALQRYEKYLIIANEKDEKKKKYTQESAKFNEKSNKSGNLAANMRQKRKTKKYELEGARSPDYSNRQRRCPNTIWAEWTKSG